MRKLTPEQRYQRFVAELTRLTQTYGIALQSVGGVYVADEAHEFAKVTYAADITSGDLYPELPDP